MIGYPYIADLFKSVLSASLVMQGRFFVCPKLGSEMNNPNIDEIVIAPPNAIKWPAALMMPPRKTGNFQYSGEEVTDYSNYSIQMMFLRPAAYTAHNLPSVPLPNTQIPTHTIPETWHDMARCAEDFLQALRQVIIYNGLQGTMQIGEMAPQSITPVSDIGNDKVSGVLLSFVVLVADGCQIEDYPSDYLALITPPAVTDSHPTHINS